MESDLEEGRSISRSVTRHENDTLSDIERQ